MAERHKQISDVCRDVIQNLGFLYNVYIYIYIYNIYIYVYIYVYICTSRPTCILYMYMEPQGTVAWCLATATKLFEPPKCETHKTQPLDA